LRWEDGPNGTIATADVVRGLAAAAETPGVVARNEGDAPAVIAGASRKVESVYEAPGRAHAALEPINCTVHVRPDRCEVWTGSQVLSRVQAAAAKVTGLPLEKVVVHNFYLGGAFGRRLEVDYVPQAVRIGQQVQGPVKVIWTREEDIRQDVVRPYCYGRLAAALDARGMPTAWTHRLVGPSIMGRWAPPAVTNGIDPDAVDGAVDLLYDIPAIRVEYVRHEEPALNTGFWRGVGVTHNTFVIESFIDELAAAAKQDPVAYRRALLGKSPRARAVLDLAAQAAGWDRPLPARRGRGVALMYSGWDTYVAQVAEVAVSDSGDVRVQRIGCAVDCGTVVKPDIVKAQIEGGVVFGIGGALWGEITLKNGRVEQSNFNNYRTLRMNETPPIEVHLDRRRFVHPQRPVVVEIGLLDPAILERDLAPQRTTDAEHHPTLDLRLHDVRLHDGAAVDRAPDPLHAHVARVRDGNLGDLGHIGIPPTVHQRNAATAAGGERPVPPGRLRREVQHRPGPRRLAEERAAIRDGILLRGRGELVDE